MTGNVRFVVMADGSEQEIALSRLPATIGSGDEADIRVLGVAPRHAVVYEREGDVVLLDSGSHQGTFLAGEEVQETVLRDGDVVQLGPDGPRLRFHAPERRRRAGDALHGRRLSDTLAFRMVHQTSRSFRQALVALLVIALLGFGGVFAWTQRESHRLRAPSWAYWIKRGAMSSGCASSWRTPPPARWTT